MTWGFLKAEPRLPSRLHTMTAMAAIGAVAGLISSVPFPLPEIRLDGDGLFLNAEVIPLHAGLTFAAAMASCLWFWVNRDLRKCLLALVLIFVGWVAAGNTAYDVYQAIVASDLFGISQGAKANREALGLLLGGLTGGAVGAGLTAFGSGIPADAIRRSRNWMTIVAVGGVLGLALYPAAHLHFLPLVLVPWQAAVAAAIGYGLTRPKPRSSLRSKPKSPSN